MCNHFRNNPQEIQTWREYAGFSEPAPEFADDVWPKRQALVVRRVDDGTILDAMAWGVPF